MKTDGVIERGIFQDDGPPMPEPQGPRLDGFPTKTDNVPTSTVSGSSRVDHTDRGSWPDIPELDSPTGGSGRK